jgi:beta-galactosidase/beta-glucuronidase
LDHPHRNSSNHNHNNQHDPYHVICVVVIRWSDGTYIEDQDHWMFAGIHRSEELIRNQSNTMMTDFRIQADDNGHLKLSIEINHQTKHYNISGDLDIEQPIQLSSSKTPNLYTLTISAVEIYINN